MMLRVFLAIVALFCCIVFSGCELSSSRGEKKHLMQKGAFINRKKDEIFFALGLPQKRRAQLYPWEMSERALHPTLSKEYFRCKGCGSNPLKFVQTAAGEVELADCSGIDEHSLPIREGKEFVYPILIKLLNAIQSQTGCKVIITAGHRCLEHHRYVTRGRAAQGSKHLLGAEVTFYVEGFEERPQEIIAQLVGYFSTESCYGAAKEYVEFQRWDLEKTDVAIAPWYNKEIFIKLYGREEGRDDDNNHPFPYIGIQVRFDRDKNEKVVYSDEKGLKACWRK